MSKIITQSPSWQASGVEHLRQVDSVMRKLIDEVGTLDLRRRLEVAPDDHFAALLYGMVSQQIAEHAALAIIKRIKDYYGGDAPSAQQITQTDPEILHSMGLSLRRSQYLLGLGEVVMSGQLNLAELPTLSDDEVVERLTAIKGIGPWTAYQFLLWHLERPDLLPVQDRFINKAVQSLYQLDSPPTYDELKAIAKPWQPYRTLACHYLLRSPVGMGVSPSWPSQSPVKGAR